MFKLLSSAYFFLALVLTLAGFFYWRRRQKLIPLWYRWGLCIAAVLALVAGPRCMCRVEPVELFLLELMTAVIFYPLVLFVAFLLSRLLRVVARTSMLLRRKITAEKIKYQAKPLQDL